jgi:CDGSH-type Zn-finger protein
MNSFLVTEGGPLECTGELELLRADGTHVAHESHTWLCRCGRSQEKPYCDGSHEKIAFADDATAQQASDSAAADSGPVRITLRSNGPLKLEGPCEVRHPIAGVLFSGNQTALCRCGQSKKKPFCDGTHREVGFVA